MERDSYKSPAKVNHMKTIILGGGCFWGMEELFRQVSGVVQTEVGYCGGTNTYPTYAHHPNHAEALRVVYDESVISYAQVLDFFFRMHNPTTLNRQGNDVGSSYRSVIFYADADELAQAQAFIARVNASGRWSNPVQTSLEPLTTFWPAEAEHQRYLERHRRITLCE